MVHAKNRCAKPRGTSHIIIERHEFAPTVLELPGQHFGYPSNPAISIEPELFEPKSIAGYLV